MGEAIRTWSWPFISIYNANSQSSRYTLSLFKQHLTTSDTQQGSASEKHCSSVWHSIFPSTPILLFKLWYLLILAPLFLSNIFKQEQDPMQSTAAHTTVWRLILYGTEPLFSHRTSWCGAKLLYSATVWTWIKSFYISRLRNKSLNPQSHNPHSINAQL